MSTLPKSSLGIAGKLTHFFLTNREISFLSILILGFWGLISFVLMPKQYNPEIVAPAFVITTEFPGASAEEVYDLVTRPLEDTVAEIPAVDKISSTSSPGGASQVTVQFLVGSNQEDAKISLNQKILDKSYLKPAGALTPLIQSVNPDDVPVIDIGVRSSELSQSSLRKLAQDIAEKLKRVSGVSTYEIKGGTVNHLQVSLNGEKLKATGISLDEVLRAIQSTNTIYTFDSLSGEDRNPLVSVEGNITNPDDLSRLIVRSQGQSLTRLGDIATITAGPGEITHSVWLHEKDTPREEIVHIALAKHAGINSTTVTDAVEQQLEEIRTSTLPQNTYLDVLNNEGETARAEIFKLTFDLIKSILIVGILLYIFLGFRNSLVASISIPLVLLAVFGLGLMADQTVNRITLFALILSLGLLVDDAIVVVENIARYFRLHPNEPNKIHLIVQAVNEVGGALSLSTLTMALAFLPMAFVTGMMGPYMGPIPFFVPAALLVSLLLSVTINPYLAHLFLAKGDNQNHHDYEQGFFYRLMQKIETRYAQFLSNLLAVHRQRRRFLLGIGFVLLISLILPLTPLVPFRMLPKANKDQFYIYLDLPKGTALSKTTLATQGLEDLLLKQPEVSGVESFIGTSQIIDFNGLFKGSSMRQGTEQATLKVRLTPHEERSITSEAIATETRHALPEYQTLFPDAHVRLMEDPPGPPVKSTYLLKIKGSDTKTLEAIAQDLAIKSQSIPGIVDLKTSVPERGYDYLYHLDREKAQLLGITPHDAVSALKTALSGTSAGLYHQTLHEGITKEEQEFIIVRYDQNSRNEESDLSLILLSAQDGTKVPLSEILTKDNSPASTTILTDGREETVYVSGEMENRSIIYAVLDLFPLLLNYHFPNGEAELHHWSLFGTNYQVPATGEPYSIEIDGEWKLTLEVFRDLGIAMGFAIFLIYFVLAAKAKSLFTPLLIMVSIPLSLIGVLPGFAILYALKGTYFNATSMIGVIALAGLAVKNAVIYLEYLEPLKQKGLPLVQALVEAGRIRLLPIVLTSLAAILGSLTIVSDPVWEGLAWSIILGLTASTLLTLIVFPLVYFVFERKKWDNKK